MIYELQMFLFLWCEMGSLLHIDVEMTKIREYSCYVEKFYPACGWTAFLTSVDCATVLPMKKLLSMDLPVCIIKQKLFRTSRQEPSRKPTPTLFSGPSQQLCLWLVSECLYHYSILSDWSGTSLLRVDSVWTACICTLQRISTKQATPHDVQVANSFIMNCWLRRKTWTNSGCVWIDCDLQWISIETHKLWVVRLLYYENLIINGWCRTENETQS